MNALVPASAASLSFGEVRQLAVDIARSGLFGIKTPEQAMALMMISQAEGRHPALAARDYDIIQGRPAKKSEAMHRDFFEAGGKIKWHSLTDELADATFSHPQGGDVRISWDHERAQKAGLGTKGNWKAYPRQMLRSRLISEGVRTVWPMATSGMYETGEVADFTGTTIEADQEPPKTETQREQINREIPLADKPLETTVKLPPWKDFLKSLETAMRSCTSIAEVNRIIANDKTQFAMRTYKDKAKAELDGIIAEAIGRFGNLPNPQDEIPPNDAWSDMPGGETGETDWPDLPQRQTEPA